jgi:hypothetical protein
MVAVLVVVPAGMAVEVEVEEGGTDLSTGLLEYLCGILSVLVILLRTLVEGDWEIGKRIWIENCKYLERYYSLFCSLYMVMFIVNYHNFRYIIF